jgi:hypothetical protein
MDSVVHLRSVLHSQFFMTVVIPMSWTIWTARNDLIFKGIPPNLGRSRSLFCKELMLLKHRVKPSMSAIFDQWVISLVFHFLCFLFCFLSETLAACNLF